MILIQYCTAWTECGCLINCGHSHASVREAVACIQTAGAYVVAVDAGTMRALNVAEEAEFQFTIRSFPPVNPAADTPVIAACTAIDSGYAVMTRIRFDGQWTWTTWMCFPSYAEAAAHAREGDRVVRFRSAQWLELLRETAVVPPSHACADTDLLPESEDETLVEFVFRLLATVEFDLELGSKGQHEPINSEGSQKNETPSRKRA
jgi:hypothetical protein